MARVGSFISRSQAELAAGFLASHGIDSRVSADDMGGMSPDVAMGAGGIALEVLDEDAGDARALLAEAAAAPSESDGGPSSPEWQRVIRKYGGMAAAVVLAMYVYNAFV